MGITLVQVLSMVLFRQVFTQDTYYNTFKTNLTNLNNLVSTVVISSSKEISTCPCDLTPNVCDYLCCCDPHCSEVTVLSWKENSNNICLDKSKITL